MLIIAFYDDTYDNIADMERRRNNLKFLEW
jgi:hypothetical protein